jgi:hypothetical protein
LSGHGALWFGLLEERRRHTSRIDQEAPSK